MQFRNYVQCLFVSPSAGKNRRLKQAKEEAQAEIEQYRLQREKEFKTKEAAVRHCIINTVSENTDYAARVATQTPK